MASFKNFKQWLKLRNQEMLVQSLAIGINSTVDLTEDKHIIMLDYDIHDIQRIRDSVKEVQRFWNLSDATIFRTKNGHHAFFFYDIVPYERLKMIINYARDVDPMFKYISRFYDHKTIRVSGKYTFKDIQYSEVIPGIRSPTMEEMELGSLKREEHKLLIGERDG